MACLGASLLVEFADSTTSVYFPQDQWVAIYFSGVARARLAGQGYAEGIRVRSEGTGFQAVTLGKTDRARCRGDGRGRPLPVEPQVGPPLIRPPHSAGAAGGAGRPERIGRRPWLACGCGAAFC